MNNIGVIVGDNLTRLFCCGSETEIAVAEESTVNEDDE